MNTLGNSELITPRQSQNTWHDTQFVNLKLDPGSYAVKLGESTFTISVGESVTLMITQL